MTIDMEELGYEYFEDNYKEFFEDFACSTLKKYGYERVKDPEFIKFKKGDIEVYVWPGVPELEFITENLKGTQDSPLLKTLREKLEKVMEIEDLEWDEEGFYLIGTVYVDEYMYEYIEKCVAAVEEFFKMAKG